MCMLEDSPRQCRELALAVVAVQVTMIVLLVVYPVMHASALGADIAVLIFGAYDEVYRIILGWKSFKEIKLVHCSVSFGYGANVMRKCIWVRFLLLAENFVMTI